MPAPRQENSVWVQVIRAITSLLSVIVLILLIIAELFWVVGAGLQSDTKSYVIKFALVLFAVVVINVLLLFWIRPQNLPVPAPRSIDRGKVQNGIVDQDEQVLAASRGTTTTKEILRAFWKPDSNTINEEHEEQLKTWKKENGLAGVSVTTLVNADLLEAARAKAIADIKIKHISAKV